MRAIDLDRERFRQLALDDTDEATGPIPCTVATETPVDRPGFREILLCGRDNVDMSRAKHGLPLLVQHDSSRLNIGVVSNIRAAGGRLRGEVRFGGSQAAREVERDVRDGVVTGVSVGYLISEHRMENGDTLVATKWLPYEASAVSVPADPQSGFYRSNPVTHVHTDREVAAYRLLNLVDAEASKQPKRAHLEIAMSLRGRDHAPCEIDHRGHTIPTAVVARAARRDLTVGNASKGGNLVHSGEKPGTIVESFRARTICAGLGATILGGLEGDLSIPRKTGSSTVTRLSEGDTATAADMTFDEVAIQYEDTGTTMEYSRRLAKQSSVGIDDLVVNDLISSLLIELDRVALAGSGSGEPQGIIGASGVGTFTGTGALTPTRALLLEALESIEADDVTQPNRAFVMSPKCFTAFAKTLASTNAGDYLLNDRSFMGYPVVISSLLPEATSASTGSMIFGAWDSLILAEWASAGPEVIVNPYTASKAGKVSITAFLAARPALRNPEAFVATSSIDVS